MDRAYQKNRKQLSPFDGQVVDRLDDAFGHVRHDLWNDGDFNVAPSRLAFAQSIRGKHLDDLTDHELDFLMFKSMATMGGVDTLKFLLPRFFAAWFANLFQGGAASPDVVLGKLELADIASWPYEESTAALEALIAATRLEAEQFRASYNTEPELADKVTAMRAHALLARIRSA